MLHKIINSLFVLLFAFLLVVAVLSTISIIEAHARAGVKASSAIARPVVSLAPMAV